MNEFIKNMRVPSENSLLWKLWEVVNFEMAIKFFVLYIFIIWIATVVWVIKDITNRSWHIIVQILCTSNTLLEKYYSEIEENLDIVSDFITQHIAEKKEAEQAVEKKQNKEKKYQTKSEKKKNKTKKNNSD